MALVRILYHPVFYAIQVIALIENILVDKGEILTPEPAIRVIKICLMNANVAQFQPKVEGRITGDHPIEVAKILLRLYYRLASSVGTSIKIGIAMRFSHSPRSL